jgi:stage II sporulation protein GA (sporulation sigma-E factor processing peptidase)
MGIIYIDLLVIINIYITFFMIKATSAFLHRKITNRRILFGSLAGGISSLLILLPAFSLFVNIGAKIIIGMLLVLIVFGYKSGYEYLKNSFIFIIVNVIFAGLTLLLFFFAAPLGMDFNNGYVYFDISFISLIVTTALAYGLIRVLRYALDVKQAGDREYKVAVTIGEKTVTLEALADSGNMLNDYFSGLPVIICSYSLLEDVAPEGVLNDVPPVGVRLLPYNTISSAGLIPTFRVDEIVIKTNDFPDKSVEALIGVTKSDSPAIFNPKLLI